MTQLEIDPTWPTQVFLPGQTAAAPGPVDMTMMYVMHHGFRRDLVAFAEAAEHTPVTDRESWQALAERWQIFSEILHKHHSGEDAALWPLLLERTDGEGRETLEAMEAEHAEIDPLLEASAAGFARLAQQADESARVALAARLVAARESLAHHLEHEETGAIPIIQRVMSNEDWLQLEEEHFKKGMSFGLLLKAVPWAIKEMPAPVREGLFAQPGGRMHQLLWRLTRRGFERREQVAFRYVA